MVLAVLSRLFLNPQPAPGVLGLPVRAITPGSLKTFNGFLDFASVCR